MKIIVVDCANVRIDVLNVPENMVGEDVELFPCKSTTTP